MPNTVSTKPAATSQTLNKADLLSASASLAFWKSLIVPATQPLQVTMRQQQLSLSQRQFLPAHTAFSQLCHKTNGKRLLGMLPTAIFRGSISAMTKEAIKNGSYKAILFKGAPKLIATKLHHPIFSHLSAHNQHTIIAGSAACVASAADTAIGGPFERYATYRATSQGNSRNASFIQEMKNKGNLKKQFQFIYKGAVASFIKTGVSCFALFAFSGPIQRSCYQQFQLQPGDPIPLTASGLCAITTGTSVALLGSPFDIVKTIHQMPKSSSGESTINVLRNNIQQFGIRGVTAGLPIKILMTIIGWGAVSAITQQTKDVPSSYLHTFSPSTPD